MLSEMDYWRLCESLNIYQAAALIVGVSPACIDREHRYLRVEEYSSQPNALDPHYSAAVVALKGAIRDGTLKAKVRVSAREYGEADALADIEYDEILFESGRGRTAEEGEVLSGDGSFFYRPHPDWDLTTVAANDLRAWLASRGFATGFFFPNPEEGQAGYLDRNHPNYAPKLAAAIRAWEAVTSNPERLRGKTPKQAITKWLNEHAATYGLTKDDGTPNATGVEEAAKLANWKPEGGASKTPGEQPTHP